jgi:hypothetical protein
MLEAHYGVAMAGAVLNSINTRLDSALIAFTLDHGEAKVLIADREFSKTVKAALAICEAKPLVIDYDDPEFSGPGERLGNLEYEDFLREGSADFTWLMPQDEWEAIALNYTSGTTGDPKGVVYHHRGAYLLALANVVTCGMSKHPVYLWTLRGPRGADLRRHRDAQGHASVRRADRDVGAAHRAGRRAQAAAACRRIRHRGSAAAGSRAGGHAAGRLQRHPCLRPHRSLRAGQRQRLASRMERAPRA